MYAWSSALKHIPKRNIGSSVCENKAKFRHPKVNIPVEGSEIYRCNLTSPRLTYSRCIVKCSINLQGWFYRACRFMQLQRRGEKPWAVQADTANGTHLSIEPNLYFICHFKHEISKSSWISWLKFGSNRWPITPLKTTAFHQKIAQVWLTERDCGQVIFQHARKPQWYCIAYNTQLPLVMFVQTVLLITWVPIDIADRPSITYLKEHLHFSMNYTACLASLLKSVPAPILVAYLPESMAFHNVYSLQMKFLCWWSFVHNTVGLPIEAGDTGEKDP